MYVLHPTFIFVLYNPKLNKHNEKQIRKFKSSARSVLIFHRSWTLLNITMGSKMSATLPELLRPLATYRLPAAVASKHRLSLILAQGSVLDFDNRIAPAAIVNAANVGCLGGGGVDGAISIAGGPNLDRDREMLPIIVAAATDATDPVRCPVGQAVVTGPGEYGSLKVPYVIHAVGPNYCDCEDDLDNLTPVHNLLKSAYKSALDRAVENNIQSVAFSLPSAGVFRGSLPLKTVLTLGVTAIQEWSSSYAKQTEGKGDAPLSQIVLCAFTEKECKTLQTACHNLF
jgi:O-acetyl-ADP-ribose deacetylase (regulator of RNase III)